MPDYSEYIDIYNYGSDRIELSFEFISNIAKKLGSISFLFCIYAIISLGIKLYLIKKISENYWGSLALYLSFYLILHDLIQIRAGAASAFMLLSFYLLTKKKKIYCVISMIIAVFFHISAIIGISIFIVKKIDYNRTKWSLFFFFALFIGLMGVLTIPNSLSSVEALDYYMHYSSDIYKDEHGGINFFSTQQLFRYFFYFLIMYCSTYLNEEKGQYWFKVYYSATIILCFSSVIPAFAFRLSDLFYVSEIFILPNIVLKRRNLGIFAKPYLWMVLLNIVIVCFVSKYLII